MQLKDLLEIKNFIDKNDFKNKEILNSFINKYAFFPEKLIDRKNSDGHFTVSGLILSEDKNRVLLIKNNKFNKWLMPGGHIERGESIINAIKREIMEEVGINEIDLYYNNIAYIDVHKIPERGTEFSHWHYDLRHVFLSKNKNKIKIDNNEVGDYKWVKINSIKDDSILNIISRSLYRKPKNYKF